MEGLWSFLCTPGSRRGSGGQWQSPKKELEVLPEAEGLAAAQPWEPGGGQESYGGLTAGLFTSGPAAPDGQ